MEIVEKRFTFLAGAGLTFRFGVSCIDVDILIEGVDCESFPTFTVDVDFLTADDGLDGGLSFFCICVPMKS